MIQERVPSNNSEEPLRENLSLSSLIGRPPSPIYYVIQAVGGSN